MPSSLGMPPIASSRCDPPSRCTRFWGASAWQRWRPRLTALHGCMPPPIARRPIAASLVCPAMVTQEMRNRFAEAQQRQGELLRMAQDGRLDAGGCMGSTRCGMPLEHPCAAPVCCLWVRTVGHDPPMLLGISSSRAVGAMRCRHASAAPLAAPRVLCIRSGIAGLSGVPSVASLPSACVCRVAMRGGGAQAAGGRGALRQAGGGSQGCQGGPHRPPTAVAATRVQGSVAASSCHVVNPGLPAQGLGPNPGHGGMPGGGAARTP